jgi:hypothetical protein
VQVQYNVGSGWVDFGTAVSRYDGTTGWKLHTFDLSAVLAGQATARIRLHGISAYGNNIYVDQVMFMAD